MAAEPPDPTRDRGARCCRRREFRRAAAVVALALALAAPAAAVVEVGGSSAFGDGSSSTGLSLDPYKLGTPVAIRPFVDRFIYGTISVPESSHREAARSLRKELGPDALPRSVAEVDGIYLGVSVNREYNKATGERFPDYIEFYVPGGARAYDLPFLGPDSVGGRIALLEPTLICDHTRPVRLVYIGVVPDAVKSVDVTLRHGGMIHPKVDANVFTMSIGPDAVEHTTGRGIDGSVVIDTPLDKPDVRWQNGKWPEARVDGPPTTDKGLLASCARGG